MSLPLRNGRLTGIAQPPLRAHSGGTDPITNFVDHGTSALWLQFGNWLTNQEDTDSHQNKSKCAFQSKGKL